MADPATHSMNISLPEPLKRYVDEKVASGLYGSASEFVREAIREKLLHEQDARLNRDSIAAKLLEALDGPPGVPYTPGHFEREKQALRAKLQKRRSAS